MNWILFISVAVLALVLTVAGLMHWPTALGLTLFAGVLLLAAHYGGKE